MNYRWLYILILAVPCAGQVQICGHHIGENIQDYEREQGQSWHLPADRPNLSVMTRLCNLDARVTFDDSKLVTIHLFYPGEKAQSDEHNLSFDDVVRDLSQKFGPPDSPTARDIRTDSGLS